jgi:hypothetical protein
VNVRPLFVANAQSPKLIEPSERPLHDPTPSAQPAAMFGVALRKKGDDVADAQTLPDCRRVIATVPQHAMRTMAWTSMLSLQGWDSFNECEGLLRVIAIGPSKLNC